MKQLIFYHCGYNVMTEYPRILKSPDFVPSFFNYSSYSQCIEAPAVNN